MIEVCFNDTVAGSLNLARVGGRAQKIAIMPFYFSEGDIQSSICPGECPRKEVIRRQYSYDRFLGKKVVEAIVRDIWADCMESLQIFKADPPQVRVWADNTPDARCGFLFLADLFKNTKTEIHLMEMPVNNAGPNTRSMEHLGWGCMHVVEYVRLLERDRVLSEEEINVFAAHWKQLQKENAPLRVVENGTVRSTDMSYYDDRIRKEFPEDPCEIAQMVEGILKRQKIPTYVDFINRRIQYLIDSGELIVLKKHKEFYKMVISRAK